MDRKNYTSLIAVLVCFLTSCVKDKPTAVINTQAPGGADNVYVVCEGNYTNFNASLYQYNPANDSVYGDIYQAANNEVLGDVFQSMTKIGSNFFLCINNSRKVIVTDALTNKKVATIPIPYPRYILPVSATKAYVTSEYNYKVYIINTQDYTITDSIALPNKNTEGMCLYGTSAFVCTWDTAGNNIFKIDIATDKVTQAIKVAGRAPQEVLLDKNQMLWVLSGDQPDGYTCWLTRLDPSTGDIEAIYQFPAAANPMKPVFNTTKDTLYYIGVNYYLGTVNNGIYRMGINEVALPAQPLIAAFANQYFYALGISPATGYLYVGNPKNFNEKGSVYIYHTDGTLISYFSVGMGPGHFYFDN